MELDQLDQLEQLCQDQVDGLLDALRLAQEIPEPIHAGPMHEAPVQQEHPFLHRVQSIFTDPNIQALLLNWMDLYTHWNWDQLLSIFQNREAVGPVDAVDPVAGIDRADAVERVGESQRRAHIRFPLKKQMVMAKGKIQSGKTKFMLIMNMLLASLGYNPVFVLRNLSSDIKQLYENFESEKQDMDAKHLPFPFGLQCLGKKEKSNAQYVIYVALSNPTQLKKIKSFPHFCLSIDEIDALDSCDKTAKVKILSELKSQSIVTLGVSATIMDALIKNDNVHANHIVQLPIPDDYKGLSNLVFVPITGSYTGVVGKPILRAENEDLAQYIDTFSKKNGWMLEDVLYPNMSLVTVARCVDVNRTVQETVRQRFPSIASILFTGEEMRMVVHGVSYLPKVFKNVSQSCIVLPGLSMAPEGFVSSSDKPSIRQCIQWFKNQGAAQFPRIMIFASDNVAGRGISFTSSDHAWHLTEQFFLTSASCDEPELIQKIRLCGRYRDTMPLTLYTTSDVWEDLNKADRRLEEVMDRVTSAPTTSKDTIDTLTMNKAKFTKRDMTKNFGTPIEKTDMWADDEDHDGYDVPVDVSDTDKIRSTIHRHFASLKSGKSTKTSTFLSLLDPSGEYTREDLLALLGEAKFDNPTSILLSFLKKKDYGGVGGGIFTLSGSKYRIMDEFVVCWRM
jgi:hypothetical protein